MNEFKGLISVEANGKVTLNDGFYLHRDTVALALRLNSILPNCFLTT